MLWLQIIFALLILPFMGFLVEYFLFGRDKNDIKRRDNYLLQKIHVSPKWADRISEVTQYLILAWTFIYLISWVFVVIVGINIWIYGAIITLILFIFECIIAPRMNIGYDRDPESKIAEKWTLHIPGCRKATGVFIIIGFFVGIVGGYYALDALDLMLPG